MTEQDRRILELEEALAESGRRLDALRATADRTESRLRQILDALPVGVATISLDGIIEEANDAYLDLLPGARRENTIGKSVLERLRTVAEGRVDPATGEKLRPGEREEWVRHRLEQYQDPTIVPDVAEYVLSGGVILRTTSRRAENGVLVQITQDVAAIRRREQRLLDAIEMMPAAICIFDTDQNLAAVNRQFIEHIRPELRDQVTTGASFLETARQLLRSVASFDEGAPGEPAHSTMTESEIEALAQRRTALINAQSTPVLSVYTTWDGRIFNARALRTPEGGIVRVAVDVTAERRNSQRFAEVVASLDDAVFLFDGDLRLRLWSPSVLTMFDFLEPLLVEGVDAKTIRDTVRDAAIESDRFERIGILASMYVRRFPDGRSIQFRTIPTAEGGLLVECSDQTSIRRAHLLASRAERMESLGRLVAGVAHEINTPLGVAVTTASALGDGTQAFLKKFIGDELRRSDLEEYLAMSTEASGLLMRNLQRAAELVASFKRVSVDELSGEYRQFDLAEIFEDVAAILRPQLRIRGHEFTIDCPADVTMTSYPGAFTQILTNFLMNSIIHGYPEGGAGRLRLVTRRIAEGVEIRYSDDGVGVSPDILGRIFDHFFTTRRGRGGSGLGLGIVHNLVTHQLGGEVEALSPPGQGLEIRIVVPLTVAQSSSEQSWI